MDELVSVIIPTYNRADIITRAIDSVRNQTYKNIEIIVVDDGSIDNTKDVIAIYKDSRIIYVKHDSNKGGAAARNTGIGMAKGDFIAFLDDDDIWFKEKIERQLNSLRNTNFDAVCCASKFFGSGSKNNEIMNFRKNEVKIDDLRYSNCIGSTSVLIAKSIIFKNIQFDYRLRQSQDWDMYLNILTNGFRIGFINESLVLVTDDFNRARITTSIQNIPLEQLDSFTDIFEKYKIFFGWWFYNYHKADKCLSYLLLNNQKWNLIIFAIKKTNILVVLVVMFGKTYRNIKRLIMRNSFTRKNESSNN